MMESKEHLPKEMQSFRNMTSHSFDIPCYMFDCNARLRPSSFLDIAQELAAEDCELSGFSDHDLKPRGLVWILARMKVRFVKMPERGAKVTEQTWHKGIDGIFFIRDFRLLDSDGDAAVLATSSWIIMDIEERKAVRSTSVEDLVPIQTGHCENVMDRTAERLVVPASATLAGSSERVARYSDLDYNGHVNNVRYTVWSMDTLPFELVSTHSLKELTVNFNREVKIGDTITLNHYEESPLVHYVEGICMKGKSFVEKMVFE